LLHASDPLQRRAAFTNYHLWVTPHVPDERYAGGTYPNQSRGDDGLAVWTRADRSIHDTDIVLWYTLGVNHFVRAEDWPMLPLDWRDFQLRPFNFFNRNPALDLPAR
jgi:primary-amine oxidase